jgi:hypothetical protein
MRSVTNNSSSLDLALRHLHPIPFIISKSTDIDFTRGNQKVPGMVVLHCNVRTYSSAYPITFTLRTNTHTRPDIVGSAGRHLLASSGVRPSMVAKRSETRRVRWLGDVWLGAETTVPACHFLCKTCIVTLCPGGMNSRCTNCRCRRIPGTF